MLARGFEVALAFAKLVLQRVAIGGLGLQTLAGLLRGGVNLSE